jgi:SSS family solute:Na+ symporter
MTDGCAFSRNYLCDWYVGFTSSQVLAEPISFCDRWRFRHTNCTDRHGDYCGSHTTIGGLKAVIYTDTIQWLILIGGLVSSEYRSLITL